MRVLEMHDFLSCFDELIAVNKIRSDIRDEAQFHGGTHPTITFHHKGNIWYLIYEGYRGNVRLVIHSEGGQKVIFSTRDISVKNAFA